MTLDLTIRDIHMCDLPGSDGTVSSGEDLDELMQHLIRAAQANGVDPRGTVVIRDAGSKDFEVQIVELAD